MHIHFLSRCFTMLQGYILRCGNEPPSSTLLIVICFNIFFFLTDRPKAETALDDKQRERGDGLSLELYLAADVSNLYITNTEQKFLRSKAVKAVSINIFLNDYPEFLPV